MFIIKVCPTVFLLLFKTTPIYHLTVLYIKSDIGLNWAKIKVSAMLCSFLGAPGKYATLPFPAFHGPPYSLAHASFLHHLIQGTALLCDLSSKVTLTCFITVRKVVLLWKPRWLDGATLILQGKLSISKSLIKSTKSFAWEVISINSQAP